MALLPLQVAGPANILFGGSQLGYSVDGVDIQIKHMTEDVHTDIYGPLAAFDVQHFLLEAEISADVIVFDQTVMNTVLSFLAGGTLGVMAPAGTLLIANSKTAALIIASTPAGTGVAGAAPCYKFPTTFPTDARAKPGTRKTVWSVKWRALCAQQTSGSTGAVLFSTACS